MRSSVRRLMPVALVCAALAACTALPDRPEDAAPTPAAAPTEAPSPAPTVVTPDAPPPAVAAAPSGGSATPAATPPATAPSIATAPEVKQVDPAIAPTPPAAPETPTTPVETKPVPAVPASPLERELAGIVHHVVAEGVVVVLGGDRLGEGTMPRLTPESTAVLDRIVLVLKRDADRRAAIVAYHASPGSRDYNIALAERRANVVRQYLVEQGVRPHRIAVRPYGDMRPVSATAPVVDVTDAGRRVELIIGRMPASTRRTR